MSFENDFNGLDENPSATKIIRVADAKYGKNNENNAVADVADSG
jgi:hypothetical protein